MRSENQLEAFLTEIGITASYLKNESGTKLARPGLFWLLGDCKPGDLTFIEQVDRLSRLSDKNWKVLRAEIGTR